MRHLVARSSKLAEVDMSDMVDRLRGFTVLDGLTEDDLHLIAGIAALERHPAGAILAREGEEALWLYIILTGRVLVTTYDTDSGEGVLDEVTAGEILGWSAVMTPYRYTASARVLEDVEANAVNTALRDRRFRPMTPDEVPLVVIEVSVLSVPRPLPVSSLAEAYAALRPGVDGVIVEAGAWNRATFLPKMWEAMPNPEVFLEHLWVKAGVEPGVWHEGTRLQTYTARAWREAPESP
jgi:AmmeMemoRadiSam system protein A